MQTTETKSLPKVLVLNDVSLGQALVALTDKLTDLAHEMNVVRDLSVDLDVQGDRASLQFRACR